MFNRSSLSLFQCRGTLRRAWWLSSNSALFIALLSAPSWLVIANWNAHDNAHIHDCMENRRLIFQPSTKPVSSLRWQWDTLLIQVTCTVMWGKNQPHLYQLNSEECLWLVRNVAFWQSPSKHLLPTQIQPGQQVSVIAGLQALSRYQLITR